MRRDPVTGFVGCVVVGAQISPFELDVTYIEVNINGERRTSAPLTVLAMTCTKPDWLTMSRVSDGATQAAALMFLTITHR